MAGQFSINGKFTIDTFLMLKAVGFVPTVLVDLSHNRNIRILDKDNNPISSKDIELDISLAGIGLVVEEFYKFSSCKSNSALFQIYRGIMNLSHSGTVENCFKRANVKFEVTNFSDDFVSQHDATIADALAAVSAPNAVSFNNLQPHIRQKMGMYEWLETKKYVSPALEKVPRTAVP